MGESEVVKGEPDKAAPETLSVKRAPAKAKADRNNKGLSAEQLRLNPMLAAGGAAEEKKGPLAASKPALTAE